MYWIVFMHCATRCTYKQINFTCVICSSSKQAPMPCNALAVFNKFCWRVFFFLLLLFYMLCHGQKTFSKAVHMRPTVHFCLQSCRLTATDLWPWYSPSNLMSIDWFLPQSSCGALLLSFTVWSLPSPMVDSPCSKKQKMFVCMCMPLWFGLSYICCYQCHGCMKLS